MITILKYIDKGARLLSIGLIRLYQLILSPDKGIPSLWLKGRICSHEPHCSQYAINVLQRYNFFSSRRKIMERVSSCTGGTCKTYDPDHYKVVFMSSAPIGVPFLQKLHTDPRFELVGVVTMPDKPSGRGMNMHENVIKTEAKNIGLSASLQSGADHAVLHDRGINYFIKTPESLKLDSKKYADDAQDIYQWLQKLEPDFIVVIAYGKIIPQHILDLPKFGPINIHGSILPEYRGASPIQSVFLDKKKETGITIMRMFAELDTGDMIDTLKFPLPLNRTALDCIQHMQKVGPDFLANTLESYAKGRLVDKAQNNDKATYCSKIEKEQGEVNPFTDSLDDIFAKHKGYFLRPKVHFTAPSERKNAGKTVIIDTMICDEKTFEQHKKSPLFTKEGVRGGLSINPAITTLTLKPEGKKAMEREDFTNGYIK